jgi:hypothetical protein
MKCIHDVELELDTGNTCMDCDVWVAKTPGTPKGARQVDAAAVMREYHRDKATPAVESAFITARREAAEGAANMWEVERRAQIWQAIAAHQADILALQAELLEIATQ